MSIGQLLPREEKQNSMTENSNNGLPWSRFGVEAAIIVASILLALGVDEWRQEGQDRGLEREYLVRLADDLDTNLRILDSQQKTDAAKVANARRVFSLVASGEWGELTPERAVISAYFASPSNTPDWVDDTYEELKSTGRLGLILNPDIRTDLLAYYRTLEVGDWAYQLMSTAYRDAVRERMNPDLQLALRQMCGLERANCQARLEGYEYDDFVDWLAGNRALADGLTRVIVQWSRGEQEYLPQVESATIELKKLIKANLDR